eukprot:TRINITY_DN3994_c0_g3_i4.p1 TRINITY_DN3994_c0_g3~~TRINITY_DN3994_c0_g3_i4.p1  ORF type:complete len:515 (+),score=100.05 TRINITY_DN3994_c0_g3_i4:35-1546(+)
MGILFEKAALVLLLLLFLISHTQATNPCDSLTITRKELDGQIIQLEWFNDEKYVYAVTRTSVWVSQDEGQTWSQKELGKGTINSLFLTAAPNQQLVLEYENSSTVLWKTSDHGSTWSRVPQIYNQGSRFSPEQNSIETPRTDQPLSIYSVIPHPTQQDWLVVQTYNSYCLGSVSDVRPCHFDIKLSKDFGETWSSLSSNVAEFSWADAGKNNIPVENCIQLKAVNVSADIRASNFIFQHSTNLFQRVDAEIPQVVDFGYYFNILYIAQKTSKGIQLLVSPDQAKTVIPARFPSDLQQNYYSILPGINGLSYVAVDHTGPKSSVRWANLYVTDFTSESYVLSLENVRKELRTVDFAAGGIDGIQFANVYDLAENEVFPTETSAVVSAVTFNNGGIWQFMRDDSKAKINLQGFSTANQKPQVSENAPGIVLSLANTGETLDEDASSVFLSRDAGLNWLRLYTGSFHFAMADHGGLVLLADESAPTRNILSLHQNHDLPLLIGNDT